MLIFKYLFNLLSLLSVNSLYFNYNPTNRDKYVNLFLNKSNTTSRFNSYLDVNNYINSFLNKTNNSQLKLNYLKQLNNLKYCLNQRSNKTIKHNEYIDWI